MSSGPEVRIGFEMGTLVVELRGHELPDTIDFPLVYDHRTGGLRAEGLYYRRLLEALVEQGIPFEDEARGYRAVALDPVTPPTPYAHQEEALDRWREAGMAGVVVMPTGSGKTYLAQMAMAECRRSCLVVVPTLDLVAQWVRSIESVFRVEAGIIGGGEFEVREVTVITYDSAVRHMENLGNRFGFIVFDECHHLPGEVYSSIARLSLAPFRLGLTATPERSDGGESLLRELVGPLVMTSRVSSLAGDVLAPYQTIRLEVALTAEEEARYREAREVYLEFCRDRGLRLGSPGGWRAFLQETARSREGRRAFEAYRLQREIPLMSESKFRTLASLLEKHATERIIIFTHVNDLAYRISRRFLVPIITHQTPLRERTEILERFSVGTYPAVVTSKVLNEGVDVPEASVGIVMSGSGSVREHVQRLGRILRRREGKLACLYELVAADTHEKSMSYRRTRHEAYRR